MFHDLRRGRVLAARDRSGIKPLVWTRRDDGTLVMASEAQAILRAAGVRRAVDTTALRQLLRFNHPLGEYTFFEGVQSLEPGLGDPRLARYWSRDTFERVGLLDFDVCDAARSRLARKTETDAVTAMGDEWLFSFALTTSIIAVDLCGA